MLFSRVALIVFMTNLSICITTRYNGHDEGGDWQYGDTRWFAIDHIFENQLWTSGPNCPRPDCNTIMLPNANYPDETHEDTEPGGDYNNVPRYYLKNKRATDNRRDHYIASRYPLTLIPVDVEDDPDRFKDIYGKPPIADIFCHDSTMTRVRVDKRVNPTPTTLIKACGIVEILVMLCMIDPKVTPGATESKTPLIEEAFDADIANIDIGERDRVKTMVQEKCARFFRLENLGRKGNGKDKWVDLFGRHLKGAMFAGYEDLLVLDANRVWQVMGISELLTKRMGENGIGYYYQRDRTYKWPNNKEYWYFCCRYENDKCLK